jgi:hypothetical protein
MTPIEYFNRKITFTNIVYDTTGCTRAEVAEAKREGDFLPTISIKTGDFLEDYGDLDRRAQWSLQHETEDFFEPVPMHLELEFLADDILDRGADFISDRTGWLVEDFDYTID